MAESEPVLVAVFVPESLSHVLAAVSFVVLEMHLSHLLASVNWTASTGSTGLLSLVKLSREMAMG